MTDSGVQKTLISEKHFGWMLTKNPEILVKWTNIRLKPCSSYGTITLHKCCDIQLTKNTGRTITLQIYINKDETKRTPANWVAWNSTLIQMKEDVMPITQGRHPIPIQFKKPVKRKIEYIRDNRLVERRFHRENVRARYITWSLRRKAGVWMRYASILIQSMNGHLVQTKIPIPMTRNYETTSTAATTSWR